MLSDPLVVELIGSLHAAPVQLVYVCAGGGTQALADLLAVAGASRTLLMAHVPYSARAFDAFLETPPARHVAPATALRLAGRALARARALAEGDPPLIGAACSATIATDRPKRGPHHACIATWSAQRSVCYHLTLDKGARDRQAEEALISRLVLHALAEAADLPQRLPLALRPADGLTRSEQRLDTPADELLAGAVPFFGVHAEGYVRMRDVRPQLLLPGAFNPLHAGHTALAQAAADFVGQPVAFELSAVNVDKPPLARATLLERLTQFAGRWPIYVTRAPTFLAKARLFPGATFVIGYDTAVRVLDSRYYGDAATLDAALRELAALGCRFLVAGRLGADRIYRTLNDLTLPPGAAPLFRPLPDFRRDISSTDLRQNDA